MSNENYNRTIIGYVGGILLNLTFYATNIQNL